MDPVQLEDITKIRCAHDLHYSPDGMHAVFMVSTPDSKKNTYRDDLFLLDCRTRKVKQLTDSGAYCSYLWDDSSTLLLQHTAEEDQKDQHACTDFYRLAIDGGEALKAFSIKENVIGLKRINEGSYAVKVRRDRNLLDPDQYDEETCHEEKDYHVIEEVPLWGNGRGFVSGIRSVLYLYDEADGRMKQITGKNENVSEFSVNGPKIIYISRTYRNCFPDTSSLSFYDTKTCRRTVIVKQGQLKVESFAVTGKGILFAASDMKTYGIGQESDLYRVHEKTGRFEKIWKNPGLAVGDMVLADTFRAGGDHIIGDSEGVWFTVMNHYWNEIHYVDSNGTWQHVLKFDGAVSCFDTMNGKDFLLIGSRPDSLNEVFLCKEGKAESLYALNTEYLSKVKYPKTIHVPFRSSSGCQIDGFLLKPLGVRKGQKVPGVLAIHGGPRCAYGNVFFHELQALAGEGYAVFWCNPHGSSGYGEEFADLRGRYGAVDYQDLMEFTDHILKKYPMIDPDHLGASGGSYGGFMCNWIEGHTDRFAAIASQRSVSNWISDFGSSEIGIMFDSNEMAATPWTDMQKMWDHSPLKYACNGHTPILFIHSMCDYNCPLDQGVEMFTAMKYFKVPAKMVLFEGENHSLSRSGKPKHRVRRLREIVQWFDQYLKSERDQ